MASPILVVEDDPWTRLIGVVLDPTTSQERRAAFADFMSPDEPNFAAWCDALRARAGALYPSDVRLVPSQAELRNNLAAARAVVVESLAVGREELACAPKLKVVQKYGAVLRNIDIAACAAAGVKVLKLRRRANIACAEHAFALMLALARRIPRTSGLTSLERLGAEKIPYKPFDRRHVPGANWARIGGTFSISSARGCRPRKKRRCAHPIVRWRRCSRKATGSCRSFPAMRRPATSSTALDWR
jgi:hypothetical protein